MMIPRQVKRKRRRRKVRIHLHIRECWKGNVNGLGIIEGMKTIINEPLNKVPFNISVTFVIVMINLSEMLFTFIHKY